MLTVYITCPECQEDMVHCHLINKRMILSNSDVAWYDHEGKEHINVELLMHKTEALYASDVEGAINHEELHAAIAKIIDIEVAVNFDLIQAQVRHFFGEYI